MKYKIWIKVEEANEKNNHCEENLELASIAEFNTRGEAVDFACRLKIIAKRLKPQ